MVKSRRMRWAGHVARKGEDRVEHSELVGKPDKFLLSVANLS